MPALLTSTSRPEGSGEVVDHICRAGEVPEVGLPHLRASAVTTDLVRGLLGSLLVLVPCDTDVEAVGGEADRRRTAYPRVRACDDRYRALDEHFIFPAYESAQKSIDGRWNLDKEGIVAQAANEASKLRTRHGGRGWAWTSTAPRR
jgi:hypothetical protein